MARSSVLALALALAFGGAPDGVDAQTGDPEAGEAITGEAGPGAGGERYGDNSPQLGTAPLGRATPEQRDERNRAMVRTRVTLGFSLVFVLICVYLLLSHLKNRRLRDEIEFLVRRVSELEGKGDRL